MKKKTIIVSVIAVVLVLAAFLVYRFYLVKPKAGEVITYLNQFNKDLKEDVPDSLMSYFDKKVQKSKKLIKLLRLLANANDILGNASSKFRITLHTEKSEIKVLKTGLIEATVPVNIDYGGDSTSSSIIIKLRKIGLSRYSIVGLDGRSFLQQYISFDKAVDPNAPRSHYELSPITLAAFKTAQQLKTRYDSVVWFQHINNKSYFYVIKGKMDYGFEWNGMPARPRSAPTFKMGLVNPELKEIIPPDYDLIRNIGGTIDGLVEVEKDNKKGFFDLNGKNIVPVIYDELYPLNDEDNLALLQYGADYYYLKKDSTITDKAVDIKIADVIPKIKNLGVNVSLEFDKTKNVLEDGERQLMFPPSYLVDLDILPRAITDFLNPVNKWVKVDDDPFGTESYDINAVGGKNDDSNWFAAAFSAIISDYVGDRAGLYETKNVVVVDKKQNKLLSFKADSYYGPGTGGAALTGLCNDNGFRVIGDNLFEYKTTSDVGVTLGNKQELSEVPYFHYLQINNGKLQALPNNRSFSFTKYVKIDDSYLCGCYLLDNKRHKNMTTEMLQYIKNEIFASYNYKFKNPKWTEAFGLHFEAYGTGKGLNDNVDDSLTAIDKYNINWLDQKIKAAQKQQNKSATK